MNHVRTCSECPHRFLLVTGTNRTRSVEIACCYECGTSLARPLIMTPSQWFPFPRNNFYHLETEARPRSAA